MPYKQMDNLTTRLQPRIASAIARTKGLPDENLISLDYPTQLEILKRVRIERENKN